MKLTDILWQYAVMALTVWKEARGEPYEGKVAVARVIRNRASAPSGQWPKTLDGVCLQPLQFSCWNTKDPNRGIMPDRVFGSEWASFEECLRAVMDSEFQDPTNGATHYVNLSIAKPQWANALQKTAVIGSHTFLR